MRPNKRKEIKRRIENLISENGGYSKSALLSLGVSWPPPKGWKEALIRQMAGQPVRGNNVRKRTKNNSKAGGGFYSSWEWKAARYEALRIHGQRCQCCGWRPGDTTHGRLVVDHIRPRSKYPHLELTVDNLQVLCNDCNMGKSNTYADDFRDLDSWLARIALD